MNLKRALLAILLVLLPVISCIDITSEDAADSGKENLFYDFTTAFQTAEIHSNTDIIDLGTEEARMYLIEGWGTGEKMGGGFNFIWSIGKSSKLWFYMNPVEELIIEFRCQPFIFPGSPVQEVAINVNGHAIGRLKLAESPKEYWIKVAKGNLIEGKNEIEFNYRYCRRPKDVLDKSKDPRLLGVAWDYIRFGERIIEKPRAVLDSPPSLFLPAGSRIDYFIRLVPGTALEIAQVALRGGASMIIDFQPAGKADKIILAEVVDEGPVHQSLPGVKKETIAQVSFKVISPQASADAVARLVRPALIYTDLLPGEETSSPPDQAFLEEFKREVADKNLIICLIDAARADHFGTYGYTRDTTPNIDKMASESVLFERAYSAAAYTLASVGSIFTGVYPGSHQVLDESDKLSGSWTTLAEMFQNSGVETVSIIANPNASRAFGYGQGFNLENRLFTDQEYKATWEGQADRMVSAAIDWIEENGAEKIFFLYLHIREPHEPYFPPEGFKGTFLEVSQEALTADTATLRAVNQGETILTEAQNEQFKARYDENLSFSDSTVGKLVSYLKDSGLWERSIFVLLSDHGEGFGEHGKWLHGSTTYNEMVRVPLIIHIPGTEPGRRVDEVVVSLVDLFPTMVDLYGLEPPEYMLSGESLAELLAGNSPSDRLLERSVMTWSISSRAEIMGHYKLIASDGIRELFDLSDDRREMNNLTASHPVIAGYLNSLLRMNLKSSTAFSPDAADLSKEDLESLRDLGYIH